MAYTVRSGDTLWTIAQRLLGSGARWRELLGPSGLPANFDPRRLTPGTVIYTAGEKGGGQGSVPPQPAAPAPAPAAAPASAPGALPVQPGLKAEQWAEEQALQKWIATLQSQAVEAQLAANPTDFVTYELYKRRLRDQMGITPQGTIHTDPQIQSMVGSFLGPPPSDPTKGTMPNTGEFGQFGVWIPHTQEWSRQQFTNLDPTEQGILSSFLSAGTRTQDKGQLTAQNPQDYFQRLQKGLVPTAVDESVGTTQYG